MVQKLYVLDKAGFPQFTICWSSWCSTQPSFSVTPFSQLTSSLLFYHAQSSTFLSHYSCFSLWHQFRLTSPPSPFFLFRFFSMVHQAVLTATAVVFMLTFLTSGFLLLLVLCLELPLLFWKRLQPFPIFLSQGIMVERPSGWICRQRIWSERSEWFGKNKGTNEERKLKCNEWKRGHKIPRNAWQLKICIHLTSASHGREVLLFFFFFFTDASLLQIHKN